MDAVKDLCSHNGGRRLRTKVLGLWNIIAKEDFQKKEVSSRFKYDLFLWTYCVFKIDLEEQFNHGLLSVGGYIVVSTS